MSLTCITMGSSSKNSVECEHHGLAHGKYIWGPSCCANMAGRWYFTTWAISEYQLRTMFAVPVVSPFFSFPPGTAHMLSDQHFEPRSCMPCSLPRSFCKPVSLDPLFTGWGRVVGCNHCLLLLAFRFRTFRAIWLPQRRGVFIADYSYHLLVTKPAGTHVGALCLQLTHCLIPHIDESRCHVCIFVLHHMHMRRCCQVQVPGDPMDHLLWIPALRVSSAHTAFHGWFLHLGHLTALFWGHSTCASVIALEPEIPNTMIKLSWVLLGQGAEK